MEGYALAVNILMEVELAAFTLEALGKAVGEAVEVFLVLGELEVLGAEALALLILLVEAVRVVPVVLAAALGHVVFVVCVRIFEVLGVLVGLALALVAPLAVVVVIEHDADVVEAGWSSWVDLGVDGAGRDEGCGGEDEGSGELHGCGWW